jgi:hypothetical protein
MNIPMRIWIYLLNQRGKKEDTEVLSKHFSRIAQSRQ